MTDNFWTEALTRRGSGSWAEAVKRAAIHYDDAEEWARKRAAREAWARTPKGRAVLAWRKVKTAPKNLRWWLAKLVYPGDLDRDMQEW